MAKKNIAAWNVAKRKFLSNLLREEHSFVAWRLATGYYNNPMDRVIVSIKDAKNWMKEDKWSDDIIDKFEVSYYHSKAQI